MEILLVGAVAYAVYSGRATDVRSAARLAGTWLGRAAGVALRVRADAGRVASRATASSPGVRSSTESLAQSMERFRAVSSEAAMLVSAGSFSDDMLRRSARFGATAPSSEQPPGVAAATAQSDQLLQSLGLAGGGPAAVAIGDRTSVRRAVFEAVYDAGSSMPQRLDVAGVGDSVDVGALVPGVPAQVVAANVAVQRAGAERVPQATELHWGRPSATAVVPRPGVHATSGTDLVLQSIAEAKAARRGAAN